MYTARATPCVKGYSPKSQWARYESVKIATADTLIELKQLLAKHYGASWKGKRPMYQDQANGKPIRVGWVVGMRMAEGSDKWLQQDWISISECKPVDLED
jgi:hypothetical protein